ncbi:flavin reductase family protein [Crocinitomix algicola]|uniref:flavin reductase family protein n=1 Tax=Crocinitomix algicola TaxID=1740263 RepID=UPI00082D4943|nr:flavin reductase [Crocinitomix algicola]
MQLKKEEINNLDRKFRLNLINSITGIKPANLIGTRSKIGEDNVAIFSSVVHLGSYPAQIGMVMRPQNDGLKDTYANILETEFYTINHITESFIEKAHYTSAKLPKAQSEFDRMNLKRSFIDGFFAPFVGESKVKIGMKFLESINLPNGCIFVVGEVVLVDLPDDLLNEKGQLNLTAYEAVGIGGLNNYYALTPVANYPYVRINEIPHFNVKN